LGDEDDTDDAVTRARLAELLGGVSNLAEFSRISGVSRRMLDRYKLGTEPSLSAAARIAKALNVQLDALVGDQNVSNRVTLDELVPLEGVMVPLLSVVASAGNGYGNHDVEIVDRLPFSRALLRDLGVKVENASFIRVSGDSMAPTINDGDVLLVDARYKSVRDDGIYVLVVSGDVRLKRVQRGINSITLISDNEKYAPEVLSAADADQLQVAGKVRWKGSEI